MHHPTDRIAHTTAFVTPVVEHWLEREIAQWVHPMKDRSDDPSHHERTLLPQSYISLSSHNRLTNKSTLKVSLNKTRTCKSPVAVCDARCPGCEQRFLFHLGGRPLRFKKSIDCFVCWKKIYDVSKHEQSTCVYVSVYIHDVCVCVCTLYIQMKLSFAYQTITAYLQKCAKIYFIILRGVVSI